MHAWNPTFTLDFQAWHLSGFKWTGDAGLRQPEVLPDHLNTLGQGPGLLGRSRAASLRSHLRVFGRPCCRTPLRPAGEGCPNSPTDVIRKGDGMRGQGDNLEPHLSRLPLLVLHLYLPSFIHLPFPAPIMPHAEPSLPFPVFPEHHSRPLHWFMARTTSSRCLTAWPTRSSAMSDAMRRLKVMRLDLDTYEAH